MEGGDDWCLVEDALLLVQSLYIDRSEPEAEPVSPPKTEDKKTSEVDVLPLLPDNSTLKPAHYEQEEALALLSPSHRRQFITTKLPAQPNVNAPRVAFATPSARLHEDSSFADRLRATFRSVPKTPAEEPTMTELKPFTRDMGTQMECKSDSSRQKQLQAALVRTLKLSMDLKAKSQLFEQLELTVSKLRSVLEQRDEYLEAQTVRVLRLKQSLAQAERREALSNETQEELRAQLQAIRNENASLKCQVSLVTGGRDLSLKSIGELERLEDSLQAATLDVRSTLRTKYRAAMRSADQTNPAMCVACLTKPVSVRLEPCQHVVLCSECSLRVTTCPIDRTLIKDKVLTHGLNAYLKE
ncbi:hypothetical protein Poli38472_004283 [Pythium oligandrum]|uniref:RING-type domain-containing protein n=1 Tax=Pythium oligandrum TaxID=41045 RepID=A0A8K1CQI1_PYTOL|nr:hypothetical protein Poli38472_004283 [Pythium oligandrum]|eukprot:TMW66518.1 hypothetical protein Poli38472_004283 [Pythium oligandrum]